MRQKVCALVIIFITIFSMTSPTAQAVDPSQTFILNESYLYREFNFASEGVSDGDTIIVTSAAEGVRLAGSSSTTYSNVTISIESSGNTNFIVENLNIAGGGSANTTPLVVHGLNNQMEVRGTCNFTSQYSVGVQVESGDALTIKGTGKLVARGTTYSGVNEGGAGIGGRPRNSCGTVNIVDCNVSAFGGINAAGIGGGGGHSELTNPYPPVFNYYNGGAGGTVNISGNAVVYASGRSESADIGGGYRNGSHGTLNISGNAAVFFASSQDTLVSGFNYSSAHNYYNTSYKFNYTVGGTPASSITTKKLMRITGSAYNATTGTLTVTGESFTTGDTMDVSCLTITGEGGDYTLTSPDTTASSSTTFSVTVNTEDRLNINGILDKNGSSSSSGTVYNLSAASNWNATQGADADTTNTVSVSGVRTPAVTSAVYNIATGEMIVTCTNLVKRVGSSNDIDASMFTVYGVLGGTFTLTNTSDVEVLSETSFELILSPTDKSSVNVLVDAVGTASSQGDIYNLIAADNWNGSVTDGDISDLTGNSIVAINVAPTPAPTAVPTESPTFTPAATTVPTESPTPAPTAKATSKPTAASSQSFATAAPTPSAEPTPTSSATESTAPDNTPVPAQSESAPTSAPSATPTSGTTKITPQVTHGPNGSSTVTINASDLPEGTKFIVLPDGSELEINGDETITVELTDEELIDFEIVALNDEKIPLGWVVLDIPVVDDSSFPIWVFFVAGITVIFWGLYFAGRKIRKDFNSRNNRI